MRLLAAVALTAASSWAVAQPYPGLPPPRPATIQVTGQAKVSETPDRVYIDIGVTTQAVKSQDAAAQNASRVAAVIAAMRRAAGSGAQLTTTEYSVSPNYRYSRNGGAPTVVGYTVSNVVQVRLDDLGSVGRVIDAATQAGSNNVQDIRFALRDEDTPRAEALRDAALRARLDADALAAALGLQVVRVLSVSEESPTVVPIYRQFRAAAVEMAAVAPTTPVEGGTIDVNATVTLTVEVAPAKR
ncbi:MAG TPA: SIMPL domain-containing protein [Steroidobacteraceae bacterium]|nr:SIMPL domain-containing protein [Steroidobacteraceae bacterium]